MVGDLLKRLIQEIITIVCVRRLRPRDAAGRVQAALANRSWVIARCPMTP
jgi:hypothetical protein